MENRKRLNITDADLDFDYQKRTWKNHVDQFRCLVNYRNEDPNEKTDYIIDLKEDADFDKERNCSIPTVAFANFGPNNTLKTMFNDVAKKFQGSVKCVYFDAEFFPELQKRYKLSIFPWACPFDADSKIGPQRIKVMPDPEYINWLF